MRGFIGANGRSYSDSQRMAIFAGLNSNIKFSRDCDICSKFTENFERSGHSSVKFSNQFAEKSKDDIPEEFFGDPSLLSDKKYNELLKKKIAINYNKKRFNLAEPVIMDEDEYKRAVARGMFNVRDIKRIPSKVLLPSGKEIVVQYNAMGSPVVLDEEFHEVSLPIPLPKRSVLKPINISAEEYDNGKYRGIGMREDYNVNILMDTNVFPKDTNREGVTNIKNVRKFLANSQYLNKFPTLRGVEATKNVKPLKESIMTTSEVKNSVGKFVSEIPVTKKWDLDRDEKRENKVDKKIKDALGEVEEKKEEEPKPSVGTTSTIKEFTTEYKEQVPEDNILKDESEKLKDEVKEEKIIEEKIVEIPMMDNPWEVNLPNPEYAYLIV